MSNFDDFLPFLQSRSEKYIEKMGRSGIRGINDVDLFNLFPQCFAGVLLVFFLYCIYNPFLVIFNVVGFDMSERDSKLHFCLYVGFYCSRRK